MRIISWLARSLLRTPAPMVVALPEVMTWVRSRWVTSMSVVGCSTFVLHQVDEVGSAAEELRSASGDGVDGFIGGGGALIVEGVHAEAPFAAARTAATMLG